MKPLLFTSSVAHSAQSYIQAYSGHNKINRLVFIADKNHGKPIEADALKLAHDEVKKVMRVVAHATAYFPAHLHYAPVPCPLPPS